MPPAPKSPHTAREPGSHSPGSRNPGSQSALRQLNQQRIIDVLRGTGPSTQAELSRHTGLSTATVSNIVKALAAGALVEVEQTTSSGRRASSVRLADNGAIAVGMDFGRRHLRIVLATIGYTVIAEEFVELPLGHRAEEGIDRASSLLGELLERAGVQPAAVIGIGVGVPGPIDSRDGTVVQGAILPEWVGIDLRSLEDRLHFPVVFDNDANLGALAEVTWGPHNRVNQLVFVKIGSGIGAGLILNGQSYHGFFGVTGEIGHGTTTDHGAVCHCGNRGCLETVASTSVMMDLLSRGKSRVTTADIVRNALNKDSATLRVLDDAGMAIGRSLAGVANLINPEVIVVGGPLASLGDILLAPISRGLRRHAVPVVGESTNLAMSSLGDRAEALGAAALVLQQPRLLGGSAASAHEKSLTLA
jgi:predicted NBD/HSP70 family sugar kinase